MHFAWVTNLLLEAGDKQQEHLHLPEIFQEIKTDGISQLSMCMHTHTQWGLTCQRIYHLNCQKN